MALLFSLLLLIQGIPLPPAQGGMVTGVLRSADGKPAVGVRVTAIPQTDNISETPIGGTLSSIAETDPQGRFTLENVPAGRYYIAAGRLDLPTYYPGTQGMASGTVVQIAAGATISGIDFTLNPTSAGRADPGAGLAGLTIPLEKRAENGKLPLSSGGKFTAVVFTDVALGSSISARLDQASINIPNYADYRVTIEGLPEGYALKAMKYGPMDILGGRLSVRSNGIGATGPGGASFAPQPQVISIVIDGAGASKQSSGVRVSGSIRGNPQRVIYLSGAPGTIFTDGSFEFRNVSPGRHTIATLNNPPSLAALAAVVIVGSKDLNDVTVESVSALPLNPRILSAPGPAGARPPGPVPLASLRGRILDAETGSPVTAGTVFVVGDTWAGCPIGPDGSFQFPRLLPGNYELEVQGQGYPTFRRAIVIDEQDLEVELRAG